MASVTTATSPYALTALDGVADQARCAALQLNTSTGANYVVNVPAVTKLYVVENVNATWSVEVKTASGTGITVPPLKTVLLRCDGTNVVEQLDYVAGSFSIGTALAVSTDLTVGGDTTFGNRLSGTYIQTTTTVTVSITSHGYVNGETVAFINTSGLGVSGAYVITVINANSFSFTSGVSQSTSGNCLTTNDGVTLNGVVTPGVIIEGSSTLPSLRVTQTGTGVAILVEDSANPDTTPFAVNSAGSVGIGTASPTQLLDITADTTAITQLSRYSTDTSSAAALIRKSRGTLAAPTIVVDGDTAGVIGFQGYDGAAFQSLAQISVAVDGTPGANDMPGRVVISTTPDGSTTGVERVRVNNAGNVIIGSGEASGTVAGNTLRAPNRTGTDVAGTNLTIQAGNGTGTGGSGFITLQTAVPSTTGSTANTMVDRLKLSNGVMVGKALNMDYGVIPVEQFYSLNSNYVGSNVNTVQSLFGVGVNLAANTIYEFEMVFVLQKTAGGTTHFISLLNNIGSGSINNINYMVLGNFRASTTPSSVDGPDVLLYSQVATATAVTATTNVTNVNFRSVVKGLISIGTAGKWTPQYQLSVAPGAAYTTLAGSYVKIKPVAAAGAGVNTGGWS
jgi:hypothetical protein